MKIIKILISIILFTQVAHAQSSIDDSLADSIDIEKIVIKSTRAQDYIPITFQNVGIKEIEKINLGQDPVVLIQELSPSIVTYSDGGTDIGNYSQLRLRGIDQSRINISLNGVPLNDMADHGTYFSNFSDFGNSIESIQIQRGAGSLNNGVASYGGAINFESINLFGSAKSGEAQLTLGSFGTIRTAAELSTGKLSNNTGFYGRFTRTESDGYKYNSGSDSYSMFFSGGKIGDRDVFKITAFSGKTQNGQSYLNVPLSTINRDPRTNFNDINDIDDFEQHMAQAQYARRMSSDVDLNVTTYYNGADGVFPFSFGGDQYMYGLTNKHFGAMINLNKNIDEGAISAGLHGYKFDRTNYEYVTPLLTSPYTRDFTDKSEISGYVRYSNYGNAFSWYGNVELRSLSMKTLGDKSLGAEVNESNSWTFLNGVIGGSFKISNEQNIYASLAKTSREPTRSDILNGVNKAEDVIDFELGWKFDASGFKLNVNAFHMSFTDEITGIGALEELSYIEIRQNVDKSVRSGIEAQIKYIASKKFTGKLNATYMTTNINEYDNGNQLFSDVKHIFAPNIILQPSIEYNFSEKVGIRLSSRYVSESFSELSNDPDFVLPSHFVLNTQLNIALTDNFNLSFMLNNVFDQLYFTEGGPIDSDFDGVVEGMGYRIQPPRHFYMMMRYKF